MDNSKNILVLLMHCCYKTLNYMTIKLFYLMHRVPLVFSFSGYCGGYLQFLFP
jgi:hypothetical protein